MKKLLSCVLATLLFLSALVSVAAPAHADAAEKNEIIEIIKNIDEFKEVEVEVKEIPIPKYKDFRLLDIKSDKKKKNVEVSNGCRKLNGVYKMVKDGEEWKCIIDLLDKNMQLSKS
ncbi:MAG: hypothetical protein F6K48_17515 [Okeania sp. SIO3H1]|uniref:hypothetical protein n=1 Tax=Okeania sp. SIO1I7 TaxID=2607772 RepID=UPI0013C60B70|nr:hypothetical protein [Okeania sp. SIO1I7]NEN90607.1 hypothetical protein [Okeania sp. SIO3H1]NET29919.1 hypothetical protein [Okeania sp. SIO1I7]